MKSPACTTAGSRTPGYTLIEMILALAVAGGLLASLAAVMSNVLAANSAASMHRDDLAALGNLGQQFRRDVHAATSIDRQSQPDRLVLELAGESRVEYEKTSYGLARTERWPERPPRRETYLLRGMRIVELSVRNDPPLQAAIVIGRGASGAVRESGSQFEILAIPSPILSAARPENAP